VWNGSEQIFANELLRKTALRQAMDSGGWGTIAMALKDVSDEEVRVEARWALKGRGDPWRALATLFEHRASALVSIRPELMTSACGTAAARGCAQLLLHLGEDVNVAQLNTACSTGSLGIVADLLDAGAEVNAIAIDGEKQTPLHALIMGSRDEKIAMRLFAVRADPHLTNGRGNTPLVTCTQSGASDYEVVASDGRRPKRHTEALCPIDRLRCK